MVLTMELRPQLWDQKVSQGGYRTWSVLEEGADSMGAEVCVQSVGACGCPEVKRMGWGRGGWVKEPEQSCRGV